jgi:hypothetical protein
MAYFCLQQKAIKPMARKGNAASVVVRRVACANATKTSCLSLKTFAELACLEGNRKIGPTLRCRDQKTVFMVLRRAHAALEALNIVEMSLRNAAPAWSTST